ncbi:hypothetical protein RN001_013640 [Aquatica leii]|uniref:Uncharacterized protein n=1 Tax=Aquatica leii TaxID=1421715 RepID=A0AAN7Q007_9COLE|nr:hypothetical protein RN001_013640 [Aquatica leii]
MLKSYKNPYKKYCSKKRKNIQENVIRKKFKKTKIIDNGSSDYGNAAAQPDITEEEFKSAKIKIMNELQKTDIDTICITTKGQRENILWFEARRNRLTASVFGKICAETKQFCKVRKAF